MHANPLVGATSEEACSIPFPRGAKVAPVGLQARRENCISAVSFFLLKIGPASLGSDSVF